MKIFDGLFIGEYKFFSLKTIMTEILWDFISFPKPLVIMEIIYINNQLVN